MTRARLVEATDALHIYHGRAEHWEGSEVIDLVFTNPYGQLPLSLASTPMVVHQWVHRKGEAQRWAHNSLPFLVSVWNAGREAFWSDNIETPSKVSLEEFAPEPGGWYPEELVRRVLLAYARPGQTIWDGFMGRGTIAKVALELDMRYVGVEELEAHVALARDYLGLA